MPVNTVIVGMRCAYPNLRAKNLQMKSDAAVALPFRPPRLLEQIRRKIRVKHYSIRTEEAYVDWARRFLVWHEKKRRAT